MYYLMYVKNMHIINSIHSVITWYVVWFMLLYYMSCYVTICSVRLCGAMLTFMLLWIRTSRSYWLYVMYVHMYVFIFTITYTLSAGWTLQKGLSSDMFDYLTASFSRLFIKPSGG